MDVMNIIEHTLTVEVCSHCGAVAGPSSHGHTDAPDWRWKRMEYVSADQFAEIIETLRATRLLAEQWKRSSDHDTRIMGADLVQILDGDAP